MSWGLWTADEVRSAREAFAPRWRFGLHRSPPGRGRDTGNGRTSKICPAACLVAKKVIECTLVPDGIGVSPREARRSAPRPGRHLPTSGPRRGGGSRRPGPPARVLLSHVSERRRTLVYSVEGES